MGRFLPSITDRTEMGERFYDIFSRLLKDRIICINGPIDESSSSLTCAQILALEADNKNSPIYLYINSPGGEIYQGLAILDTMSMVQCPIYTFSMGMVASMASVIAACGSKGKRFGLKRTRFMLHQASGGMRGHIKDMEIDYKECNFLNESLMKLLSDRMGKSYNDLKKLTNRDFYLSSDEAKKHGLIDEVLEGGFDKKIRELN